MDENTNNIQDEQQVESVDDFEARIAAVESGSITVEETVTHGSKKMSDEQIDEVNSTESDISKEKDDILKDNAEDNQVDDENKANDKLDDATINKEADDSDTVDSESEHKTRENDLDVLKKFGIQNEDEFKDILSEFKKANVIIEENSSFVDKGKLVSKAGLTEEDLGMLIAIKNGDKGTILKLAKEMNIDINSEDGDSIEAKKVDLSEFKESNIEKQLDNFVVTAKAHNVSIDSVSHIIEKWDDSSVERLLKEPESQKAILQNISNGVYEKVYSKIDDILKTDYLGKFGRLSEYEKYTYALTELGKEHKSTEDYPQAVNDSTKSITSDKKVSNEEKSVNNVEENDDDISSSFDLDGSSHKVSGNKKETLSTKDMSSEEFDKYINSILNG